MRAGQTPERSLDEILNFLGEKSSTCKISNPEIEQTDENAEVKCRVSFISGFTQSGLGEKERELKFHLTHLSGNWEITYQELVRPY